MKKVIFYVYSHQTFCPCYDAVSLVHNINWLYYASDYVWVAYKENVWWLYNWKSNNAHVFHRSVLINENNDTSSHIKL